MSEIAENLREVIGKIVAACGRSGRDVSSVELIAVSKTFPAESVREACEAGQLLFGESKLQEAEPKISALPGSLHWHFIGRVQRNKVRKLLQNFEVIHAIERLLLTYGAIGRSKSLSNYASQLLHFWGWRQGPQTFFIIWNS